MVFRVESVHNLCSHLTWLNVCNCLRNYLEKAQYEMTFPVKTKSPICLMSVKKWGKRWSERESAWSYLKPHWFEIDEFYYWWQTNSWVSLTCSPCNCHVTHNVCYVTIWRREAVCKPIRFGFKLNLTKNLLWMSTARHWHSDVIGTCLQWK